MHHAWVAESSTAESFISNCVVGAVGRVTALLWRPSWLIVCSRIRCRALALAVYCLYVFLSFRSQTATSTYSIYASEDRRASDDIYENILADSDRTDEGILDDSDHIYDDLCDVSDNYNIELMNVPTSEPTTIGQTTDGREEEDQA